MILHQLSTILHQLSIILRPFCSLLSKNFKQLNFKNDQEVRTIGMNDQVGQTMQQGLFFNALVYCLKGKNSSLTEISTDLKHRIKRYSLKTFIFLVNLNFTSVIHSSDSVWKLFSVWRFLNSMFTSFFVNFQISLLVT